ncbi:alanine racemase [Staphylococcus lutrae]|uniref:Alanine racemase n=1 Tax=Staphylococcus lutrae TaxID=155085 RepID=A0AAC9RRJ4_9STAP|nr:alanine racemase [Staphylococcus lutrae]ARJ50329.1 alanine racemase [Staphylococcus lutrae]PNZ36564.1 alanine racemase [Staphylococcus lutrae]
MPQLHINLSKIKYNAMILQQMLAEKDVRMVPVTKCTGGDVKIRQQLFDMGFPILAESRLMAMASEETAHRSKNMMIKGALPDEIDAVVKLSQISIQTEIETIRALNEKAIEQGVKHHIYLMVDWKDGREGALTYEVVNLVKEIVQLKGIYLKGLSFNFMCFRQIPPTEEDIVYINYFIESVERDTGVRFNTISGGNSSMLMLAMYTDLGRINELRIGEVLFRGYETAYEMRLPYLYDDAMMLSGRVLEIKPRLNLDQRQSYMQALVDIGQLDTDIEGITAVDQQLHIVGHSSDILMVNLGLTDYYQIGDKIEFRINYSALAQSMHMAHIPKRYYEDQGIEALINGFVEIKKNRFIKQS